MRLIAAFLVVLPLLNACAPAPTPVLEQGAVIVNNASVRMGNSTSSRTIMTLPRGAKIAILEKQANWYRVRYESDVEGWMEESTVMSDTTSKRVRELVAASRNLPAQNTAVTSDAANLRLDPGRTTILIRRLPGKTKIEVLERTTLPRPGQQGAWDVWYKVRVSPDEIGWLFAGLMDFDMPEALAPYSEERFYPAVKILKPAEDPASGTAHWYVVAERKTTLDPHLDFSGIRVFTWNAARLRHETAFRLQNLRGVYPVESDTTGPVPIFRFHELALDGRQKTVREFRMNGTLVREVKVPATAALQR